MLSKNTGTFSADRKMKEPKENVPDFEELHHLDKEIIVKKQLKEVFQDIQNVTELCLFFLKKPLNKEDLITLWKEVYIQTKFGIDLLSDS